MDFYTSDDFLPDQSIGYLVKMCGQQGTAILDRAFAVDGLTCSQWSALISIHFDAAPTCASLARDLVHDKGAMTRMMDVLEARGWVERTRSAEDRRIVRLSLTDAGRDVTMRCRDKVVDLWNRCLADWSHDEITGFITQLQKLRRTLEDTAACA